MGKFEKIAAGLALVAGLAATEAAEAGTILVNADEWALTDAGFLQAPDASQFVSNIVAEFGPAIHAYSTNFGYTQSSLATAMASAGATYTTGTTFDFSLPNISGFDALFLGGDYLDASGLSALSSYVAGGGNVYISAGTGAGGAAAEAAAWNPFLASYGIQLSPTYTGFGGMAAVSGDPLFAGVSSLYFNNPSGLTGSGVFCCDAEELFAVSRTTTAPIPLPASGLLLASAAAAVAWRARRSTTR